MNKQTEAKPTAEAALKMAIEAIEYNLEWYNIGDEGIDKSEKAIQACKEALEQPAQEPLMYGDAIHKGLSGACKPAQEPVLYIDQGGLDGHATWAQPNACQNTDIPLYTHPASSWQGLDERKLREMWLETDNISWVAFKETYHAIEQALKEKNT